MRLSQIKLAGFKSFVDPTAILLPGQIIGVVGPNGCGKSNVIDALRWVLGESKASALRGGSMLDVIFNGSSKRKPVSRASVELVFDNSLGKAAGQWSTYAEIAIKRVLQRDGKSAYYINNQQVRRKDITDIFLGTGLGARAYAIIEQGMISRIIEAKPEELRVFLEEAAGVSRYRDRRRETELRIRDTRDNLLRVGDVLQELSERLEHLGEQAKVAQVYRQLSDRRTLIQHYFWMFKKQEALAQKQEYAACAEQTRINLEGETARLREIELSLEQARAAHFQLGDALHDRQGEMYQVNADLARLEQQMRHANEQKQRLDKQIQQTEAQLQQRRAQLAQSNELLTHWVAEQEQAILRCELVAQQSEALLDDLPEIEAATRNAQEHYNALLREQIKQQQQARLFDSQLQQLSRQIQNLEAKIERLAQEQQNLIVPDSSLLIELKEQLLEVEQLQSEQSLVLEEVLSTLPEAETQRLSHRAVLQDQERLLTQTEARLVVLSDLQKQLAQSTQLQDWLAQQGLADAQTLWQQLRVEPGWELALESVLGLRLHALPWSGEPLTPPAKQAFYHLNIECNQSVLNCFISLLSVVQAQDEIKAVLAYWLADVYLAEDMTDALDLLKNIPENGQIVTKQGHILDHAGLIFYGVEAGQGVLARQNEIDVLTEQQQALLASIEEKRHIQAQLEQKYLALEARLPPLRQTQQQLQQQQQQLNMSLFKQEQLLQRYLEREAVLQEERSHSLTELQQLMTEREVCLAEQAGQQDAGFMLAEINHARSQMERAEQHQQQVRQRSQQAQHTLQEAKFALRNCQNKIQDLNQTRQAAADGVAELQENLSALQVEVVEAQDDSVQVILQQQLERRDQADAALRAARQALDLATSRIQTLDQTRLSCEHGLNPLREQLNQWILKEQEARLMFEQWSAQLTDVNETEVLKTIGNHQENPVQLSAQIKRLDAQIAALGAVNLAALDELNAAQARQSYLQSQSQDLNEALLTLEEAIRRIDKESRSLLMDTYNQVNKHLSEKFPILFRGGEARLELLGDEILDSGVQVMAQPPGKKNSSIHLMSGGEKALTAIALVFSLFELNPAPFCLLDEVDAPLDDTNTERLCTLIKTMAERTQFIFISHNKITMALAEQLIGVTMQEQGVSKVVSVDIEQALVMREH